MYNVDLRQLKGTEPTLRRPEAIRIIAGYFRISNELARQYLREILPDGTANGKGGGYLYIPCRLKELIVDIRDGGDGNQEPDIETAESPVDSALKVSYTAPDNSVRSDASNPVHAPEAKESLEIRARSKRAPDNLEYHKGHNPAPEYALPRFDDWESARDWSKKGEQATPYSDLDVAALHISHRYNLEITEKQLREFCDHNDIYCIGKRTGKKYVLDTTLHYAVLFGLLDRFMRYKPDESDAAPRAHSSKDSAPSEYVGIYDAGIHDGSWKKAIDNIFTRNEGKIDDDIITRTLKFHGIYPNSANEQEMLPFYISANRQIKRKKIARTHFDIKGARNLIIRMFGMDRMTEILNKSESLGVFNGEKSTESLEDLVCAALMVADR